MKTPGDPARSGRRSRLLTGALLLFTLSAGAVALAAQAPTLPASIARANTATAVDGPIPRTGQPCPSWVHDQYTAIGPDGGTYATWHPPVDPIYHCFFGHEHGDNPYGSPALAGRTVLFGYASVQAGMHEPHTGFKVFRWDNVQSELAPQHDGASYLAVLHQGTSGAGRFTTVFHDIEVHYIHPNDGREVHVHMLAPFGTLMVGCGANDPQMDLKVKQDNAPGARIVAGSRCFDDPYIPYEDWLTALYVGSDTQGHWKAYLDPHFAIFDPNTYCIVTDGACTLGYSDERAGTGFAPSSNRAEFRGTKREAYLNQVQLNNNGGATTFWTDPYGKLATADTPGAIEQFVSAMTQRVRVESSVFGDDRDPDPRKTVHAPN